MRYYMQDWKHYLAANPDLIHRGISTQEGAETHFENYGRKEDRPTHFSWRHYIAANKDLLAAGHKTEERALQHFLTFGFRENRASEFKWRHYLAANMDLLGAGFNTEELALKHYLMFGFGENRKMAFKWQQYLAANPDLPFQNEEDVLQHYIVCGVKEGRPVVPKLDLRDPTLTVVFVAHTMEIVLRLNRDYMQPHILFVGDKPTHACDNPNVVLVRDLPHNIEDRWRLLTFTAWYAVVKNNLYPEAELLCILEYDAHVVCDQFCSKVKEAARESTVVGFLEDRNCFFNDIRPEILAEYLETKCIDPSVYGKDYVWLCTTNLCAPRQFFKEFVDWYDYAFVVERDTENLPFYHERLAAVFAHTKYSTALVGDVLRHDQKNSHSAPATPVMVLYVDGTAKPALDKLVQSVRLHSPAIHITYVHKREMDPAFVAAHARILQTPRGGGLWMWKPYCILRALDSINPGCVLVYLDSKYVFVAPVERLFENERGDLLVWKNKPDEPTYSHFKYCKQSVLAKYSSPDAEQAWAGLIVVRKSEAAAAILREWLQMCCVYEDISDEWTGPNQPEFIDHRHDQSLLSIVLAKHGVPLLSLDSATLKKQ